jgi:hypothetical protein
VKTKRPTVADLQAMKGKRQLTMLRVVTLEEAEAAEQAGIDLVSVPPALLGPAFREAAPTVFAFPGLEYGDFVTADDYLRGAFQAMKAGGDAVYCAAGLSTVRRLREEGIPVCGHVGLIPSKATWTGGFRAVGKTAESALDIFRQVKALEGAGAFAAEIEVVPGEVAAAISNISSPRTCSARTAATIRAMPRSTATSPPNTTGCSRSASPPSANMPTTCAPAPILRRAISSASRRRSLRPSSNGSVRESRFPRGGKPPMYTGKGVRRRS